jgi:hypothetical protein
MTGFTPARVHDISARTILTTPTYDYKVGKIVIFNRDNFVDWERTCEAALIILEG